MAFVLDNSVVCGWLFVNQSDAYSEAIALRMQSTTAVAPTLLQFEVANVLRTACKRGTIIATQAHSLLSALSELPIEIDASAAPPAQLLDLALRYDLSSYDAVYLDLALRRRLPIATRDEALARAAVVAGVGVIEAG
jgi:predicted nucleic acid-binding protein